MRPNDIWLMESLVRNFLSKPCSNSVIEVAKAKIQDFGNKSQNLITTNMEKTTKEIEGLGNLGENSRSAIANKKLLGQDSSKIYTIINKAENLVIEF
jgi:hypothetical protein